MAIERAIYGSIKRGIDGGDAGYQYYTYTSGFKATLGDDKATEGRLIASYEAPKTYVTEEWYMSSTQQQPKDRSEASDRASQEHPRAFSYWTSGDLGKAYFCYGKNMGHDWTDGRPRAAYHSAVICDVKDLKQAPVFYCSSPSVCCEIRRAEFFPENGEAPVQGALVYTQDLSDQNEGLLLRHCAGFDPIELKDIEQFIREDDRVEILKSMVTAVMHNKDGIKKNEVIICDSKENMLLWIAAISYLFPVPNVSQLSFCSYAYNPQPENYDISGVFSAKLNNIFVSEEDKEYVSYYSLRDALQKTDAVYDFEEEYYASNIAVEKSPFLGMVEQAFKLRRISDLDAFKKFISEETTYSGMDSQYSAGYDLYSVLQKNTAADREQLSSAIKFAKKYADKNLKKSLLDRFCKNYPDYADDEGKIDIIADYIDYCCQNGIESAKSVRNVFLTELVQHFQSVGASDEDRVMYRNMEKLVMKLCKISNEEMLRMIGESLGMRQLQELSSSETVKWKQMYIITILCACASSGEIQLQRQSVEYWIVQNATLCTMGSDDKEKMREVLNRVFKKMQNDPVLCVRYADAAFNVLYANGLHNTAGVACDAVADLYLSGSQAATQVLAEIGNMGAEKEYLPAILEALDHKGNPERVLESMEVFLRSTKINTREFAPAIRDKAIQLFNSISGSGRGSLEQYYTVYSILKKCRNQFQLPVSSDEVGRILQEYVREVTEKYPNYQVPDVVIEQLGEIYEDSANQGGDPRDNEAIKAIFQVGELSGEVENYRPKTTYRESTTNFTEVDYAGLESYVQTRYLESVGALSGQYFIKSEHLFDPERILSCSDNSLIKEMYDGYLLAMFGRIVKDETVKKQGEKAGDILVCGIILKKKEKLCDFQDRALAMLPRYVKQGEIVKYLEKIMNDIEKDSKTKKPGQMNVASYEILHLINQIKEVYAASGGGFMDTVKDSVKKTTDSLKSLFRK